MDLFGQETEQDKKVSVSAKRQCTVLVPYPVDKAYSYLVPDDLSLSQGDYVTVPLGNREVTGVVWNSSPEDVPAKKLKTVLSVFDFPPLPSVHLTFIEWIARYNMAPLGMALKMVLSVSGALEPPKPAAGYVVKDGVQPKGKLSPQRVKVLESLSDAIPRRAAEIARRAGCSAAVVKGLYDKGFLDQVDLFQTPPCSAPSIKGHELDLSADQENAANQLIEAVKDDTYKTMLLDGVTGSGKTETYFEAVSEALNKGKQALILLPEIALSNAFLDRFKERFGCAPALWHSSLTKEQRKTVWRAVAKGESKVVVGARSALFLPYADLGLIIVDEEHDPAYKQEDNVIYNARDMAIVRAHLGHFPVVLVSATPSLETIDNAWQDRYVHLELPARFGGASLPDVHIVDMRKDKPPRQHFISPTLKEAVEATLEAGEQALLFLNRRGYAPLTLCRTCGHRLECPRCTAWLIEHKQTEKLHCHHCGYAMPLPEKCPSCEDEESFAACGPGVERIKEEVEEYFPDARTLVFASDTAGTHEELKCILDDIKDRKVDIIIGTQIIAKGHHFPNLTCVGVVDADLGLSGGDLRATERCYQLLHQVSGRAGRAERKGHVYLQSFNPDNRVIQALASGKRDLFLEAESFEREQAHMPPYSRLVALIVAGPDEEIVQDVARALGRSAPQDQRVRTLGPAQAGIYRIRGRFRQRLLVIADKDINVQKTVQSWLKGIKIPSNVRIYVDIDPQNFL